VNPLMLDEATRDAILACVRSPDELDVLVYLSRHRARYCSPQTIAADMHLSPQRVSVALEVLASRNLLDVRIAEAVLYRLDPASAERRSAVECTIDTASRARGSITRLLMASPGSDVRYERNHS
jgi:hypothetical protein